ncbi:MAG: M48 family metalloprotease [Betaproteobacteria bacterium]|nr:M48 family metalloprotease [Betaproteobacteria bacterium]
MPNFLRTLLLLGAAAVLAGMLGWLVGGAPGALAAAALALGGGGLAGLFGERLVLRLYGARELDAETDPHLSVMVRELAGRAGLPAPHVFVLDTPAANAFVVGRGRTHVALVLTRGILRLLDERELRAVLAHEFAHILRGDVLPGTLAAVFGGLLAALSHGGPAPAAEERSARAGAVPHNPLWWLLGPLAALFAQVGAAARRELAADRLGAALCGDRAAMASALQHLHDHAQATRGFPQAGRYPAGVQMMVCDPLRGGGVYRLFRCHPPVACRLQALREPEAAS